MLLTDQDVAFRRRTRTDFEVNPPLTDDDTPRRGCSRDRRPDSVEPLRVNRRLRPPRFRAMSR
jgi:hypothetical protein